MPQNYSGFIDQHASNLCFILLMLLNVAGQQVFEKFMED